MNFCNNRCHVLLVSTMLAFTGAAQAAQPAAIGAEALQQKGTLIAEKSVEISTQQSNLEKDLEELAQQRQTIEDRERQLAAAVAEHEKALAEQGRALEELERELADSKRAYQDQRRRLDEIRDEVGGRMEAHPGVANP